MRGAKTLDQLAVHHGTDKSSVGHNYTPLYERLLGTRRYQPLTLLEVGIWEGASLRMWRDFFPHATIIGVDKTDRGIDVDGVTILIADQTDPLIAEFGPYDVIIDDASHLSTLTIATFNLLWPTLNPGGTYIVEDLQTAYDTTHYGAEADSNPDNTHTAMWYLKRLADELNRTELPHTHWLNVDDLESVAFHHNCAIIHKATTR